MSCHNWVKIFYHRNHHDLYLIQLLSLYIILWDRVCGLVVRVSGYTYSGPGFDPRRYQIFWVVVGLERGPLSLVSLVKSIEELLEWRSRKQRLTAVGTRCADHVTPLYPQKLALTSPTGGGRSVGIDRVPTKATEFSLALQFKNMVFRSGTVNRTLT